MAQTDRVFSGSIPALYDRYLGPLIFQSYATELARRIAGFAPRRVLETAAGTGILTRLLVADLPSSAELVATDLNPAMLEFAATKLTSPHLAWREADALALPFPDGSFNVVVCQFGAMFFPDKVAGYREARRVLRPGGRLVLGIWDRIEVNEFARVVTDAVARLFPTDPPLFLARTPHGYHDIAEIRGHLTAAGFSQVAIDTVAHRSRAVSARDPAIGYVQGTPLRNEIEARDPARLDDATEAAAAEIAAQFGAGPVDGKIQAHLITAST